MQLECLWWKIRMEFRRSIWLRFLDPRHGDESFISDSAARKMSRVSVVPPYLNHQCRGCHQPYWAYALRTERPRSISCRLLGTTPILGCLTGEMTRPWLDSGVATTNAGDLQLRIATVAFGEEPFEMRSAYIIEMIPVDPTFSNWRALVWIDTETYILARCRIFRDRTS